MERPKCMVVRLLLKTGSEEETATMVKELKKSYPELEVAYEEEINETALAECFS